jgi:hypothetical protein
MYCDDVCLFGVRKVIVDLVDVFVYLGVLVRVSGNQVNRYVRSFSKSRLLWSLESGLRHAEPADAVLHLSL